MNDKDTRTKICEASRKEFMEYGYKKASLRRICAQAGVTTGALYFFFRDKDALFCSLVEDKLEQICEVMMSHFNSEIRFMCGKNKLCIKVTYTVEEALRKIFNIIYEDRESILLLLTKAQESSLENALDDVTRISEMHMEFIGNYLQQHRKDRKVSQHLYHWMAHTSVNVVVYAVTHFEKKEDACEFAFSVIPVLNGGWLTMWGFYQEVDDVRELHQMLKEETKIEE